MKTIQSFILLGLMLGASMLIAQEEEENFTPSDMWHFPSTTNFEQIRQEVETYYEDKDKGKGSAYKKWKRWELSNRSRLDSEGNIVNTNALTSKAQNKYEQQYGSNSDNRSNTGYWSEVGPSSYTLTGSGHNGGLGRVNIIAFHPTLTNTIYVGTPAGGLWRTTNGGTSWTPLTDGLPRIGVSGIVVDYSNPNTIYILTGDGDGADTYSIGVLKSTDAGVSWSPTGLTWAPTDFERGWKLIQHPSNSNTLFAVTTDGIQRTTNGGVTWTQVQAGTFNDIEFKPGDPTIMYATTRTSSSQFFRSTNTGATWSTAGITGVPTNATRMEIGVSPDAAAYVYLLAGPSTGVGNFKGIYRSFDSGLAFGAKSSTPNILGYASDGQDNDNQATYDLAIAVNPADVGNIITGGINVWWSTSYGDTGTMTNATQWLEYSASQYTHADIHELVYNPLDNALYCGSDGGIYKSTDDGVTWANISDGLTIMAFYKIGIDESNSNAFIGGTQDNGTNYKTTNTTDFQHIEGGDGYDCFIDASNPSNLYLTANTSVFKSTNGGSSIFSIEPAAGVQFFPQFIQSTAGGNTIFIGSSDVFRSTDGGTNWDNLGSNGGVAIAHGVNNINRFYTASGFALQMSADILAATPTWTTISGNTGWLGSQSITGIAIRETNSLDVYVSKGGYTANEKVLFSTDGGTNWTNITGSLPNVPINCITYAPDSDFGVYIGTDIGVFYRDNTLGDWVPFGNGLPTTPVFDLEYNNTTDRLYAGTFGRGLWSSTGYSDCPALYVLNDGNLPGETSGGSRYYQSSGQLTSSRTLNAGYGAEISYRAADSLKLLVGFEASNGTNFRAGIGPCQAGVPGSFFNDPSSGTAARASNMSLVEFIEAHKDTPEGRAGRLTEIYESIQATSSRVKQAVVIDPALDTPEARAGIPIPKEDTPNPNRKKEPIIDPEMDTPQARAARMQKGN